MTWNLEIVGKSEVYVLHDGETIARFKLVKAKTKAKRFAKILTDHFTTEEYFTLKKLGWSPYEIIGNKGFNFL